MRNFYSQLVLVPVYLFIALAISSCRSDLDELTPGSGALIFEKFVAIGDGYVAGYSNWGLYEFSQENSLPNLLSQQFSLVREIAFAQPILNGSGTGYNELESLASSACPEIANTPVFRSIPSSITWNNNVSFLGPFNNKGIPGLKVDQLMDTSLVQSNPFFQRISPNSSITYLQEVQNIEADLCMVWLGSQEILQFSSINRFGIDKDFDPDEFRLAYTTLLDSMLANSTSSILVANIPPILSFPYFNSISSSYIQEENCETTSLPIYITTLSVDGEKLVRVATDRDRILLPALGSIGKEENGIKMGLSPESPLPDSWVMDETEFSILQSRINVMNSIISAMVSELNADFNRQRLFQVDMSSAFDALEEGITEDGIELNSQYINGGVFSLDGLYFTPRGNAYVANVFIEYINRVFAASIPLISLADYPAVFFP